MSVSTTIFITHDSKNEIMSLIICKFNTTHISIIKIMLNMINVSEDHEIFLGTSELSSVAKWVILIQIQCIICIHMIILHEINLQLHLLRKNKQTWRCFYIVHYDAGLRFNFSLQVKYHCKIAKFFLSNTKMIKYT